jgi:NADPH:quinone reductase-like Zn-dependent oxidoreductase
MRAYELRGYGLESLAQVVRPTPRPASGQVLVRVRFVSLNYRDWVIAQDMHGRVTSRRPLVPVSDAAGEVVETGPAVSGLAPGDRVVGGFFQNWESGPLPPPTGGAPLGGTLDGVLAEYVVLNAATTVKLPDSMPLEDASTLPCAAVTAYVGLVTLGEVASGDTVLALGTGGVSIFALQIAKAQGARVILTSSSSTKLERARALGADEVIDVRATPDWDSRARALTGGKGADHCIEVGGAGTVARSLRAIRAGGNLSLVGLLSGSPADAAAVRRDAEGVRVHHFFVGNAQHLAAVAQFVSQRNLEPVIDRTFSFDDAVAAYRYLGSGAHLGKIVIRC